MLGSKLLRLLPIITATVLVLAACGANGAAPPASSSHRSPRSTSPSPTPTASPSPTASPLSCAERTLDGMSLDQRVGQLFLLGLAGPDLAADEAAAIRAQHFGSVWFTRTTTGGGDAVRRTTDAVQALANEATGGVGFLVAANQEGGLIQALRGPGFSTIPSAQDQGKLSAAAIQAGAKGWGREMVAAGVNMNFAPVADVVPAGTEQQNQPIGVLHRGYGSDPAAVGADVAAFVHGMASAGVATTAKHFPGLGRVEGNTDQTADVVDTETAPDDPSLGSFRAAVDAGVPFVMVALATYTRIDPDHLAAFAPAVMDLLRTGLGFDGVIVSDDLGATEAVASIDPGRRATDFLAAGGDLVIVRGLAAAIQMAAAVLAKATGDPGFRSLVDAAARRVLQAKEALGLLPCG